MSQERSVAIWAIVCAILGLGFGFFFNSEGLKIIVGIWVFIGIAAGTAADDLPSEPIVGWATFGAALGLTIAAVNYQSWLTPLLR
ncbi:MAG: hypothetical protein Q7S32_02490 [bacterium]|nr:hypothetical protein [bacterium]